MKITVLCIVLLTSVMTYAKDNPYMLRQYRCKLVDKSGNLFASSEAFHDDRHLPPNPSSAAFIGSVTVATAGSNAAVLVQEVKMRYSRIVGAQGCQFESEFQLAKYHIVSQLDVCKRGPNGEMRGAAVISGANADTNYLLSCLSR